MYEDQWLIVKKDYGYKDLLNIIDTEKKTRNIDYIFKYDGFILFTMNVKFINNDDLKCIPVNDIIKNYLQVINTQIIEIEKNYVREKYYGEEVDPEKKRIRF